MKKPVAPTASEMLLNVVALEEKNCTSSPTFAPLRLKATTMNSITMKLLGLSSCRTKSATQKYSLTYLDDIFLLTSSPFLFSSIPYLLISYLLDNYIFITLLWCFFVHLHLKFTAIVPPSWLHSSSTRLSFLLVLLKWHPSLLYKRFLSSILLKFHSPDLFPIHLQLIFIFFP